jgi:predicted MFS family arabinose efflux permease
MLEVTSRLRRNIRLLYTIKFLEASYFSDAIYVLFGVHYLHLTYFQAGSLFFIGWFVSIAFDFWGGIIADTIGRKRVKVIGLGLHVLAYLPYLFTKSYPILIVASIVEGISLALGSNALDALIYEQAVESKAEGTYKRLNAFSQIWLFAGIALASVIGGAAYLLDPRLPYALTIGTLVLALLATLLIRIPPSLEQAVAMEDGPDSSRVRQAISTVRHNRALATFVTVSFFAGIVSDMLFSYYQPYYIHLSVGALTLGILFMVVRIVSGAGSYLMHVLPDHISPQAIQLLPILLGLVTVGLLMTLHLPIVLVAPLFMAIGSGLNEPNMRLFINKHAKNSTRAATLSIGSGIMNFGVGLGFVAGFYLANNFSNSVSLRVILISTLVVASLSVASWYRLRARRKLAA